MKEGVLAKHGQKTYKRKKRSRPRDHTNEIPRILKEAAIVLARVENGETFNKCMCQTNTRNIKALYHLVATANQNQNLLKEILIKTGLQDEDINPCLVKILVTDLLWGRKVLPQSVEASRVVSSYCSKLEEAVEKSSIPVSLIKVSWPRYARVNTLLTSVAGTMNLLKDKGWLLVDTPDSYKNFKRCAKNLEEKEFLKDFHFEDLLVFSPKVTKEQLEDLKMVQEHKLVPIDKSVYVAAQLLNPPPGSTVLDMCAAPGRKTAHLAALMKNKGCLYAVDVSPKRLGIMDNEILKCCGMHHCVKSMLKDSRMLTSEDCPNVKYILIDPASTDTGLNVVMEEKDITSCIPVKRLEKFSKFQERLLIQALTEFPSVERIVYTTTSVLKEENEEIIKRALAKVPKFHVVPPTVERWKKRGNDNYEFGKDCLVANHDNDLMKGFFVAVLERIIKEGERESENVGNSDDEGWMIPKKTFRKRKSTPSKGDQSMDDDSENVTAKMKKMNMKKKKKEKKEESFEVHDMN